MAAFIVLDYATVISGTGDAGIGRRQREGHRRTQVVTGDASDSLLNAPIAESHGARRHSDRDARRRLHRQGVLREQRWRNGETEYERAREHRHLRWHIDMTTTATQPQRLDVLSTLSSARPFRLALAFPRR